MLPPLVLDTVPCPAFSDGNPALHPPVIVPTDDVRGYENPTPGALSSWLGKCATIAAKEYAKHPERCPGFQSQLHGSVTFAADATMPDFPSGYRLVFLQRFASTASQTKARDTKVGDPYLFGHPCGAKFRSMPEFAPHLEWLVSDPTHDYANCLCRYCPRCVSGGSPSTPGRSARKQTVSKNSAGIPAKDMEPIVIGNTPPRPQKTPRPKNTNKKPATATAPETTAAPDPDVIDPDVIIVSDSTTSGSAAVTPSVTKKRAPEGEPASTSKKSRLSPAASGVTPSSVILVDSPLLASGSLPDTQQSNGVPLSVMSGRQNLPNGGLSTSAASHEKTAAPHAHPSTPTEPLFRLGDVVWIQVYLSLLTSHPTVIPLPLPTNPAYCVDSSSLRGKIAYWPAVIQVAYDKKSEGSSARITPFWVPPLWHEPGPQPGDPLKFAPTHQYRNDPQWKGFAYVLRLVDAPVEFKVLEEYVRPFSGYVLPRTLRVGASAYEQFTQRCSDDTLKRYIATANKVYEYARTVVRIAGPAPKVLPPLPDAPPGPPGQPSWEMIQIGAEHIRVHDFVRASVSPVVRPDGKEKPVISIVQILGITWKRDSAVQLSCRQMVACDADAARDYADPTYARRWDGLGLVVRAKEKAPLLTLAVENIIGRYYPSLKGIDGWAGPRTAVAVTQSHMELA
ncbi:hypothetical protein HDU87_008459 [Geranomyces variabilis]|uniref:Cryptic loci regulator 2 N-terminal domain-containing protein n=1 Tax=Geranomyces variabilis TaxID=109894 RepID=A0AAD5XPG4_9FUNG|nr:hypothetical protein HDU87_008459 [Geranomyces variabilis]